MKLAICDDEKAFCLMTSELCTLCLKSLGIPFQGKLFLDGTKLIASEEHFDLVILDIDMPQVDGLSVARHFYDHSPDTFIIFLTSHAEMMQRAFHVRAHRFLIKPVDPQELSEALRSAMRVMSEQQRILVDTPEGDQVVKVTEIVYIESLRDGCALHTEGGILISRQTLKYYLNLLQVASFYQIHKSYLIAFSHVAKLEPGVVCMDNGQQLEMSRRLKKAVREAYLSYIKFQATN